MKQIYPSKLILLLAMLLGLNCSIFAQTTTYSYSGSVVTYIVPPGVSTIGITATGAQGGNSSYGNGGHGTTMYSVFTVVPGHSLGIIVGQQPTAVTYCAGGGGGSFVWDATASNTLLIAAGGGGGGGYNNGSGGTGFDATATTSGTNGGGGTAYGGGGTGGNGGTTPSYSLYGAGGCGWLTNGAGGLGSCTNATGGTTATGGGTGGTFGGTSGDDGNGGFGGGGGGQGQCGATGAGGGGGYSGGGGGAGSPFPAGGGGGSYSSGTSTTSTTGTATGNGQVMIAVLCGATGVITGNSPVCTGATLPLSDPAGATGGTWSSSNAAVGTISATGVFTALTAGNTVITYTVANPCGALATATVTVNQSPSPILGSSSVCVGSVTTLSNTIPGGTWTSSSIANATITPAGGTLSGVSTGGATSASVNVTYTLAGGCFTTTTETVKSSPNIFTISPVSASYCAGSTTGVDISLLGSTAGISYQLINGATTYGGSQSGTGSAVDFGTHPYPSGGYTIIATNPTSLCSATMSGTATIVINPLPSPITGSPNVCIGSTTPLGDPTPGGTWSSSNTAVAAVGLASGVVTGYVAGSPTITYTLSSGGCKTFLTIAVDPAPPAIGGVTGACIGGTTSLTDASAGGSWSSSNTSIATVGLSSGVVSGITAGAANITYTSSVGCTTSVPLIVNPLPTPYSLTVTDGGSFCADGSGVHVGLSYSSSGVDYQLYNGGSSIGLPVEGSNAGLDFGLQGSGGSYTVVATNILSGCTGNMTGAVTVTIKPLPDLINNITGGGFYCAGLSGVPVGTGGSITGIKYQLLNGSTPTGPVVSGTGMPLNFGPITASGTYMVMATNPVTGCNNILGSTAVVSISLPPNVYPVSGGGDFCAGGTGAPITLSNSDPGVIYQLYKGSLAYGPAITASGGPLSFPLTAIAGVYTVQATDGTYGCTSHMSGSATIIIDPLPVASDVTGTGSYCMGGAGLHVGLVFGGSGITYVLMDSSSIAIDSAVGSGSGLDLGIQTAGNYTVIGINTATGCSNSMTGSAVITVAPLPTPYDVAGGGNFCLGGTGAHISLSGSDAGISYQLYKGTAPLGTPVAGSGSGGIDFGLFTAPGTYKVIAKNTSTACISNMADSAIIAINPLPVAYSVTGGGSFCIGGTGADVQLANSATGVVYDLYASGSASPLFTIPGTGSSIDFGLQTGAGTYTVVATDTTSSCMKNMLGSAAIAINSLPVVHNVAGGGTGCAGGPGFHITLDGSNAGINYQLFDGSFVSGTPIAGSSGSIDFGSRPASGTYTVIATDPLTTCNTIMAGSAIINVISLPNPYPICGGGSFCAGSGGADVTICSGSDPGVSYQLYVGGTPTGVPVTGTDSLVDFGSQATPGIYTVIATNTSGCVNNMPGSAVVNAVSPNLYNVTGGGNYCLGGAGNDVGMDNSTTGVSYQLYLGGSAIGSPVTGTGTPIDFGLQTGAGIYTVVATTSPLGCTANMTGSPAIAIDPLPGVQTVTGGGSYCIGGTGVPVGIGSSDAGIQYQLYLGGVPAGPALAGTSGAVSFGLKTLAGSYSVIATDPSTTCSSNMADSVSVTIQPAPNAYLVTVTDSGFYCASGTGVHVGLISSDVGINYQLYRGTAAVGGIVGGTGSSIDLGLQSVAGTYSVIGIDGISSACNGNMAGTVSVHIVPLPPVHDVTGGGNICPGDAGLPIGLNGSDIGFTYQLFRGSTLDSTTYGTGAPLAFGLKNIAGTYSIIANSTITTCLNNMFGTPVISIDTLIRPTATIMAYPGNDIGVWHIDSIKVFVTNGGAPTFQWVVNGNPIPGATNATFVNYKFFNNDSVACIITASGPCGELSATEGVMLHLLNVGVGQVALAGSDVQLIPNPNKGTFTIKGTLETTADEEVTIEVTDVIGQVVYNSTAIARNGMLNEKVQINNALANGMYIVNLRSETGNKVFHMVVEQ